MANKKKQKLTKLPEALKKQTLFRTSSQVKFAGSQKGSFKPPTQAFRTQHKG